MDRNHTVAHVDYIKNFPKGIVHNVGAICLRFNILASVRTLLRENSFECKEHYLGRMTLTV